MGFRTCMKYTEKDDETIRTMISLGFTSHDIAIAIGREDNAVSDRIKKLRCKTYTKQYADTVIRSQSNEEA